MTAKALALLALLAAPAPAQDSGFLIRFGMVHPKPRAWDGRVTADGGRILSLEGWQFAGPDAILPDNAWKCSTREETYWHSPWERDLNPTKNQTKITPKGLVLRAAGRITVQTPQGSFTFTGAEVTWSKPKEFAGGDVIVSRSPMPSRLAAGDYPALAETWLAWQTYEKGGDRLWVRRRPNAEPEALTPAGVELFRSVVGGNWVVWAEQAGGNWDLFGRRFDGSRWSAVERLTSHPGPDVFHSLAADSRGRVYLAWQSFRDGQSDIWLRVHDGGGWGAETRVSSDPANDWEPVVATAPDGRVTIAWDTYSKGNYDVVMRHWQNGKLSAIETVAGTAAFEARPAAVYDRQGRLWLAWEEGDADWGKDYALEITNAGMGLLQRRQVRVGCYQGGRLRQPRADLASALPPEERLAFQKPALAIDGGGNPWVFFHYRTNTARPDPGAGRGFRTLWRLGASSLQTGFWTPLVEFPAGYGRQDSAVAAAARPDGSVEVAWNSDSRTFALAQPGAQELWSAIVQAGPAGPSSGPALRLEPLRLPAATAANTHPAEAADVARIRRYRTQAAGQSYRIVRGDMHRHTDLSWDGNRDGSLWDCYRYALDAAAFDYLGVADHQAGEIEYTWWLLQKAVGLFTVPGRFAPLYGYERSLSFPNGHRNVMFASPGAPVLPIPEAERQGKEGAAQLYEYLRANGGISMPHTSATGAGTDWRDNDPAVEPLVEIYQGYRRNYEHEGAPRASAKRERPEGYVWKAWAKGYKIGVQSSSDHVSTHTSYGMLYVTDVTRAAVLEAIRARRSYAATDNIVVDFRLNGLIMGEQSRDRQGAVRLQVRIEGTGAIRKVEVIRNNAYIHSQPGGGPSLEFTYVDNQPLPEESYYYIRIEQADGQLAWSSPIWIRR